jgi:hypothetical protein
MYLQMKIHTGFFHHITKSGSPSTSGLVFVEIIYSGPIYFQTGLKDDITELSWKTTRLISWLMCHRSFVENCTSCMLPHISVSLPTGT